MTATATEPPSTFPILLTVREVAEQLHVAPSTARRLASDGEIDKVRVRGSVRILRASVDAFIERGGYPRPQTRSRRI